MKATIYLVLALTLPMLAIAEESSVAKKELAALAGTWKAVAMEAQGMTFPGNQVPDFRFIVQASGKAESKSPFGGYEATITVDPKKSPKTIENLHETGPQKGQKQYGVYKLEGNKWTVCMTPPGAPTNGFPDDFKTAGTSNAIIVFERQEPEKTP